MKNNGLGFLANLFGGGTGNVVKAKKSRKQQLEEAVKAVGQQRKKKKKPDMPSSYSR